MEIWWLGHSSVRIRSNGVTLVTDPYDASLGLLPARQRADIVTISHAHPHHSNMGAVEGDPKVLRSPGEYEVGNFYIIGLGTDRNSPDDDRSVNTVFCIYSEGLRLCHLGDLNSRLSSRQLEEMNQTDVLFVPAGGVCTVSASETAELIGLIHPKIVVPVHYRSEGTVADLQPLEPFLESLGVSEPSPEPKLTVTESSLPRALQVAVLQRTS